MGVWMRSILVNMQHGTKATVTSYISPKWQSIAFFSHLPLHAGLHSLVGHVALTFWSLYCLSFFVILPLLLTCILLSSNLSIWGLADLIPLEGLELACCWLMGWLFFFSTSFSCSTAALTNLFPCCPLFGGCLYVDSSLLPVCPRVLTLPPIAGHLAIQKFNWLFAR